MLSITRGPRRPSSTRRRSRTPLLVSLAVNAVVIALFFQAVLRGYRWQDLLGRDRSAEVRPERIGFVRLPSPGTPVAPRAGGDGRPVSTDRSERPAPALVAPRAVPTGVAPVPAGAATTSTGGGSGPIVGAGGPTEGIRPSYVDPRLWTSPDVVPTAPRGAREIAKAGADSVIRDRLGFARDSMIAAQAVAAGQRAPGDWTTKGPGGKWGIDQQNIHLGKVKIPNAVLALLSSNLQNNLRGNPTEIDRERRLAEVRADLLQHAQREMNEDDFRKAVREIRRRKDRERAARRGAQQPAALATEGGSPGEGTTPDR